MNIKEELREEIHGSLDEVLKLGVESEGHERGVNSITKLTDRYIELERLELEKEKMIRDYDNQAYREAREHELKLQEIKSESRSRMISNGISVFGIVAPICLTVWGALNSWKFETDGFVSSTFGKMFMNSFKFRK